MYVLLIIHTYYDYIIKISPFIISYYVVPTFTGFQILKSPKYIISACVYCIYSYYRIKNNNAVGEIKIKPHNIPAVGVTVVIQLLLRS